jgi:hypothetical protein
MPNKIEQFKREHAFLSNFFLTPVTHKGLTFPSAEHAYQASKCADASEVPQFLNPHMTARQAKKCGKTVKPVPNLDARLVSLMRDVIASKFSQGSGMAQLLLDTDDAILIEGNWWGDTYWGVSDTTGQGENHLGKLLMERRDELRL